MESTATTTFEDGRSFEATFDRLLPVRPAVGDYALAFAGPKKGRVIKVEGYDRDSRDFSGREVSKVDQLAIVPEKELVKVEYSP